jgi:hypothetical protein
MEETRGKCKAEQGMGCEGKDSFNLSTSRAVHQERCHNRTVAGVEKGFAEGAGLGNENAYVLHQPGGPRIKRGAARRTGKGEGSSLQAGASAQGVTFRHLNECLQVKMGNLKL